MSRNGLIDLVAAVADAANTSSTAGEAFRVALEETCSVTGWPVGHVYAAAGGAARGLRDAGTWHVADESRYGAVRGSLSGSPLLPDEGAAGRAFASGAVELTDDVSSDDTRSRDARLEVGLRSSCAVPVPVGGEIAGVIEFLMREPVPDDSELLTALETIGAVLGRVVERARAEAELGRVRQELEGRIAELRQRGEGVLVLEQEQIRDPLTGLFNARYLEEAIQLETARANRANRPLALIALGVDGLETMQKLKGRGAAEAAVRAVADFLSSHVREGDVPGRLDDEFVILLPGVSVGMGWARAKQLLKGLSSLRPESPDPQPISCSVGLACFPDHGASPSTLLKGAIAALRAAATKGAQQMEQAPLSNEKWTRPERRRGS